MPNLGPAEILVILVVALLVFGPKRLPEVGRQVGRGLSELRKIQDTVRDELHDVMHSDTDTAAPSYPTPVPAPQPPAALPGAGRAAPSRYRPAPGATSTPGDTSSDPTGDAPTGGGAHAPSRFRAPGR
jgi:TatA/E family protein of Tat protein translocase